MLFFGSKEKVLDIDLFVNSNSSSNLQQLNSPKKLNSYLRLLPSYLEQLLDQPFGQFSSIQIEQWFAISAVEGLE